MSEEKYVELNIKVPNTSHGVNFPSLYELIWDSKTMSEMRHGFYNKKDNAGYEKLETERLLLCADGPDVEQVLDLMLEYAMLVEELSFTLGLKAGAALYRSLTEGFNTQS